jgi:hypothetical protein
MCRAQLKFSPPPQRTSAPTTWRSWQTLSHRMCAMMLNQDNLARTCGSPSCLRRAPTTMQCATVTLRLHLELMCGWKPDLEHYAKFHPGQLCAGQVLKALRALCYRVPVPYNLAHLVLLEGGRQLQVQEYSLLALSLQTSRPRQQNSTRVRRGRQDCQLPQQSGSQL